MSARSVARPTMRGRGRMADGVRRGPVARRTNAASSSASGRGLWVYGLRRAGSKWTTWVQVAGARGRSMIWFPTVGSSRIADSVTRGPSAWRADVGAISSAARGPVLWAYGLRRRGSKSVTEALVAGARERRMAPAAWHCRTSAGAIVPAAPRRPAVRCPVAAGFVGAGQGQVGSRPEDRAGWSSSRWVGGVQALRRKFRGQRLKRVASKVLVRWI